MYMHGYIHAHDDNTREWQSEENDKVRKMTQYGTWQNTANYFKKKAMTTCGKCQSTDNYKVLMLMYMYMHMYIHVCDYKLRE